MSCRPQLVDVLDALKNGSLTPHMVTHAIGAVGKPPGRSVWLFRQRVGFRLCEAVHRGLCERVPRMERRRVAYEYRLTDAGRHFIDG
jgi:hypothetical protein